MTTMVVGVISVVPPPPRARAAEAFDVVFEVNDTGDAPDAIPGDGICETVVGSGTCTLRAAINEANALPAQAIEIQVPAGSHTVTSTLVVTATNLTVTGPGPDDIATIAATGGPRVMAVRLGAGLRLRDGLVVTGGRGDDHLDEADRIDGGDGGCLYSDRSTLTLERVTVTGCSSPRRGGAVGSLRNTATLVVRDSVIDGNVAALRGGGLFWQGWAEVEGVEVTNNHADSRGGGISHESIRPSLLRDVTITGNVGVAGGGGIELVGPMVLETGVIADNAVTFTGAGAGGIRVDGHLVLGTQDVPFPAVSLLDNESAGAGGAIGGGTAAPTIEIVNSLLARNHTNAFGGAISNAVTNFGGTLLVRDSVFEANTANGAGGAVALRGNVDIDGTTFTGNVAGSSGGAITVGAGGVDATVLVSNSQLVDNRAVSAGALIVVTDAVVEVVDSQITDNVAALHGGGAVVLAGGDLAIRGGLVAGNEASTAGGGIHTGGVLELDGVDVINNRVVGPSVGRGGGLSVLAGASTRVVDSRILGNQAMNSGGGIDSNEHLEVVGSELSGNVVAGGTGLGGGIHHGTNAELILTDSTIHGNRAVGNREGGGLWVLSTATLTRVEVTDNVVGPPDGAPPGTSRGGGGIWVQGHLDGGPVTITESLLVGNEATSNGGGTAFGGSLFAGDTGEVTISRTAILANRADSGGAIASSGQVTLLNSTVSGNQADTGGGIRAQHSSTVRAILSTITANHAMVDAGGVLLQDGSSMWAEATALLGNTATTDSLANDCAQNNSGVLQSRGWLVHGLHDCDLEHTTIRTDGGPATTVQVALAPGANLQTAGIADDRGDHWEPRSGSPLHDAVSITGCDEILAAYGTSGDQLGNERPFGPACDVGSVEADALPPPTVTIDVALPQPTVTVGATHVPTAGIPPSLLTEHAATEGSIAATPLSSIDLSQPPVGTTVSASPLSSIPLSSIPLSSIPLSSIPLSSIPLSSIAGGWEALLHGSGFEHRPLHAVTLQEVFHLPQVQALTIGDVSIGATPLSSIPLSSIALGATPLSSIALDPDSGVHPFVQWCQAFTAVAADPADFGMDCANPSAPTNAEVTVVSVTLQGAPLSSIPLSSIPLSSIPLSSIPLSSIPLSSIDLAGTPLSSIPLSSIDLAALPLSSIPLSSIPLSSIPLSSIPLSSIELAGTPLSSIPLSSIELAGTPLSSIPLSSIPLSSIPLSSIPLSSIPLSSIPLSSIPLSSIDLAGSPLSSIPLSSIDIVGTPLSSIPLSSIPLSSIPLSSIPLSSIPLSSIPLSSIPLSSIELTGTPLSSIPLSSIRIPGTGELGSSAIAAIPLSSIPLSSIGAVVDCTLTDCHRAGATLGEAARTGALHLGATFGDIEAALAGVRLGDIAHVLDGWDALDVRAALAGWTLAHLVSLAEMTLGDVLALRAHLTVGDVVLAMSGIRLGDIADRITGTTSQDIVDALADLSLADFDGFDNLSLGEVEALRGFLQFGHLLNGLQGLRLGDLVGIIADGSGGTHDAATIRAALDDVIGANAALADLGDLDDLTLGELTGHGVTTLGELLAAIDPAILDSITLGDLLLALLARTQYPWEALDLSRVRAQALDGVDVGIPVEVRFEVSSMHGSRPVRIEVRPPFGSALVPGSVTVSTAVDAERLQPRLVDGALVWDFLGLPAGVVHTLSFDIEPTLAIGTAQVVASALLTEDDAFAGARAPLTVVEALEPNDTIAQATPLPQDTIVLSHVSSATDIDIYSFDVTAPGQRASIILSNLDTDLDLVLYGPHASSRDITDLSPRSIVPVEDDEVSALPSSEQVGPEPADDLAQPVDLTLADLAIHQVSLHRGTRDERIDTPPLGTTGTYHVAVSGHNGASSTQPYALRLKILDADGLAPCLPRPVTPTGPIGTLPVAASLPADLGAVILVHRSRLAALYGQDAADAVADAADDLVAWVNGPDGAHLGISAAVLPIDGDAGVRAAYQTWDQSPCGPETANAVVSSIVRVLDDYREARPSINHIVIAGGDDVVPFARVPDRTQIANERSYAPSFSDANNALFGAFASSHLLTDDPYGDLDPYAFADRALFVVDNAVGRLVEHPDDIVRSLRDFVEARGLLDPVSALVAGYDFLTDGSEEIVEALRAALDGTLEDIDELISETWTRQDLEDLLLPSSGIGPRLASVNAHFDHFRALPGIGNLSGDESDLFLAAALRAAAPRTLAGSLVFSMGCHGGLSVSDLLVGGPGDVRALDFAQAITEQGGIFVGNTGYGYGDTEIVALSELLMGNFARRLDGALSVGEALLYAKQEYAADLTLYGVYDEKALMEATLYGIPFYRLSVDDPPAPPAAPPAPMVLTDPISGVDTSRLGVISTPVEVTTDEGSYWAVLDPDTGQHHTTYVHDRPPQPRETVQFSLPDGLEPHDALVLGMTTTQFGGVDPFIAQPIVDHADERVDRTHDVVFPASPVRLNPQLTPAGRVVTLSATTGWFRTTSSDGTGTQRIVDEMEVLAHFAQPDNDDFTRPVIRRVTGVAEGGVLSLVVDASDDRDGADGVRRVYILVVQDAADGQQSAWVGLDLVRTSGTSRWTGSLPVGDGDVEFLVQAVDAAGNVGITTNKAVNFRDEPPALDPPSSTLQVSVTGEAGNAGWYVGPVTVTATVGFGIEVTHELDGGPAQVMPAGGVTVTDDGPHTIVVRTSDGQQATRTFRIDQTGPTALVLSPVDGGVYAHRSGVPADGACLDPGSGSTSCQLRLNGVLVTSGTDVTTSMGTNTLSVISGPDVAGNPPSVASRTVTFTVVESPVAIDIKPGDSSPAPINLGSSGTTPVALLSTATFDATALSVPGTCLGPAHDPAAGTCLPRRERGWVEDVNGDGIPDLVLFFTTSDLGLAPEATEACLKGRMSDGLHIRGCDAVVVVG